MNDALVSLRMPRGVRAAICRKARTPGWSWAAQVRWYCYLGLAVEEHPHLSLRGVIRQLFTEGKDP